MSEAKVLRREKWEYLEPSADPEVSQSNIELGNSTEGRLYNLMYDIGERKNLLNYYPEVVKGMAGRIVEILESGQTR